MPSFVCDSPWLFVARGCLGCLQVSFLPRLRRTTRGVAALASPRVPSCFFAAIAEDNSRGGCFGEPPSAKLLFLPRLRRTTRGVAALASPRVPSCFFAAIAEDDSRGGCFGEPPSAKGICFKIFF